MDRIGLAQVREDAPAVAEVAGRTAARADVPPVIVPLPGAEAEAA